MNKEVYIVQFETARRAQYWRVEFVNKFAKDVVNINQIQSKVELVDSIWYFLSQAKDIHGMKGTLLSEEDLYIILDDIERKGLDSYEGPDRWERKIPED